MNHRQTAVILALICALLLSISTAAQAGTEPSPFRVEIGTYRLNFVEGYALTAQQMVKALLACPPDDTLPTPVLGCPPDDTRVVNAVNRLARQILALERLMMLTGKDVIVLATPPDDVVPAAREVEAILAHSTVLAATVEAYLSTPPDDIKPEFISALKRLLEASWQLSDSAQQLLDRLSPAGIDVTR